MIEVIYPTQLVGDPTQWVENLLGLRYCPVVIASKSIVSFNSNGNFSEIYFRNTEKKCE